MAALVEQPNVEIYNYTDTESLFEKSFNFSELIINEYYILFKNNLSEPVWLETLNNECHNCEPTGKNYISSKWVTDHTYNSKYSEKWWFSSRNGSTVCEIEPNVAEFGLYEMDIEKCELSQLVDPVNIGIPIIGVILIYLAVAAIIVGSKYLLAKNNKKNEENAPVTKKQRVRSLDTFRGLSITLMILVNYGGGGYNFLEHAVWNGLTLADVVFPWFLWIMGVCIPISIQSALKRNDNQVFTHILKRSAILFMLGLIVNGIGSYDGLPSIYSLRVFGVLQRFSLCYFVVATTCLAFMKKEYPENPAVLKDLIEMFPLGVCALMCLTIHTAITFALPIPDCPVVGYLGPGGIQGDGNQSSYGDYFNCTGGAAGYIDRLALGEKLMYRGGQFKSIYGTRVSVDPEGLLGTLNSVFQVFLGVQAGITLLMYKGHHDRVIRWVIWSVVTGIIGGGLCGFAREDGVIPINKNLWSLSFVFVTTCFAFLLMSVLYCIVDYAAVWAGKPFLFAGMNPTILYVGQALTYTRFPFQWGLIEPALHFQQLSQAVWGTMCWWIVAYWLYEIKFFLSI